MTRRDQADHGRAEIIAAARERKAAAMAEVLLFAGVGAADARELDTEGRQWVAALAQRRPPSQATWDIVCARLDHLWSRRAHTSGAPSRAPAPPAATVVELVSPGPPRLGAADIIRLAEAARESWGLGAMAIRRAVVGGHLMQGAVEEVAYALLDRPLRATAADWWAVADHLDHLDNDQRSPG